MAKKKKDADKNKKASARAAKREKQIAKQRQARMLQIGLLAVAILAVAGFAFWPRPKAASVDAARLIKEPFVGAEDPAIVITEFADFGCPACRSWHNAGIKEDILANYGDKVQFIWRDFPVITAQSPKAAEAGQCAYDQGKFWEYHDYVYEVGRSLSLGALKGYAKDLELDTAAFDSCLDSSQHKATVQKDLDEARQLRLRGTPSFVVGDKVLPGPPNYQTLANMIEEAIANN